MADNPPEAQPPPPEREDDLDAIVTELLGRRPQGDYTVAVRRPDGSPVVLANAPFLHSGRPMPTRFWLVDPALNKAIGRLESTGGVKQAEAAVGPELLAATHERYRRERDRLIPADHHGPAPSGGVGGTRQGVKCLHAHYAHHLAGGDDPVGRWVHKRLREVDAVIEGLLVAGGPATSGSAVTIDIGIESTRLAAPLSDGTTAGYSLPIGAHTVTAAYLRSDPPDPGELSAALSVVELHLDDVVRERPELAAAIGKEPIVGTGAIRYVAEVELGVADGDDIDGYCLRRDAAEELFRAVATETHEERAANPGLAPDHVGWIVGAMCILLEFMRRFAVDEVRVSTLGSTDGFVAPIRDPGERAHRDRPDSR